MQTIQHNTAMRNAFNKALGQGSYKVSPRTYDTVLAVAKKGSGSKSRAMWAKLSPEAYPAAQLHSNDVVTIKRVRYTVAALARGVQ